MLLLHERTQIATSTKTHNMTNAKAYPSSVDRKACSLVALIEPSPSTSNTNTTNAHTKSIQGAASLLSTQWPHLGSFTSRAQQLRSRAMTAIADTLPMSYVLEYTDADAVEGVSSHILAHVRVQEASDVGRAAAVTAVVVAAELRGKGLGKLVMELVEQRVKAMGYGYVYLWTDDARAFYSGCGYHECDRVSLSLPVFKGFQDKAVSVLASLEENLSKQLANRLSFKPRLPMMTVAALPGTATLPGTPALPGAGTSALPGTSALHGTAGVSADTVASNTGSAITANISVVDTIANAPNVYETSTSAGVVATTKSKSVSTQTNTTPAVVAVWMRKRLVDFLSSVNLEVSSTNLQIRNGVTACTQDMSTLSKTRIENHDEIFWRANIHDVPWQQQVGPACGLAAIRMCCDASERARELGIYQHDGVDGPKIKEKRRKDQDSLLEIAIEKGMSFEGEVFNVDNVHVLLSQVLMMQSEVVELNGSVDASTAQIVNGIDAGHLIIFPYDRSGSHHSTNLNGSAAHYCVIVGYAKPIRVSQPDADDIHALGACDTRLPNIVVDAGADVSVSAAGVSGNADGDESGLAGINKGMTNIDIKWLKAGTQVKNNDDQVDSTSNSDVLFIFQHSAKDQLVVEHASELLESNGQLLEPKQGSYNVKQWKTDDMNLAGRCVFVKIGS